VHLWRSTSTGDWLSNGGGAPSRTDPPHACFSDGGFHLVRVVLPVCARLLVPDFLLAPYLLLVVVLHTLASLLYTPTTSALVADFGSANLRGRYLATYEFCWGIASAITPVLFTTFYAVTPALLGWYSP